MKKLLLLAVVSCVVSAYGGLWSGDTGFETYAVGTAPSVPWNGFGGTPTVINTDAKTGLQCVELQPPDFIGQTFTDGLSMPTISLSLKHTASVGTTILYVTNSESEVYAKILFAYYGGILNAVNNVWTGGNMLGTGRVTGGVWHDVSMVMDHLNHNYDLWYDGVQVGNNIPFYSSTLNYPMNLTKRVYIDNSDTVSNTLIDNFNVVPEPATLVLLLAGGVFLRKRK